MSSQQAKKIMYKLIRLFNYGLFWSWNLIFCIVALFILVPYVVVVAINDAMLGAGTWGQAGYALFIVVIPIVTMALGVTVYRRNPSMLLKLFYGFEMPVVFLILMRLILLRDINPGMVHFLFNIFIAIGSFFFLSCIADTKKLKLLALPYVRVILAVITLMTGCYLAALMLPFAIPFFISTIKVLVEIDWLEVLENFFLFPAIFFAVVLGVYSFSLFIFLPFAMTYLYISQFIKEWKVASKQLNMSLVSVAVILLVVVNIGTFIVVNQQSQQHVFNALGEITDQKPLSIEQANYFLEEKGSIRTALVNAYLGAYRYVSTDEKSTAVLAAYKTALGSSDYTLAKISQAFFNAMASPFLYDGKDFRQDKAKAAVMYKRLFDTPIEKAEKHAIIDAIQATWEREEMAAGLINAANRHVLVTEQQIWVKAVADTAQINIVQRLENQTFTNQEVVMHFSLPEEAVLTGLWLSDDESKPRKYPFVIAPRGAAQQVYNDEVKRRVDPSLLEKVGPRQYRLRAFPVLAKNCERSSRFFYIRHNCKTDPLFVEYEYTTTANNDGSWPLPKLLEQRNLFWNHSLGLTLNGQKLVKGETWLPEAFYYESENTQRKLMKATFGNTIITAKPRVLEDHQTQHNYTDFIVGILIDSSYSMNTNRQAVTRAISWLEANNVNYDLYSCNVACTKLPNKKSDFDFLSNQQPYQQLSLWKNQLGFDQYNMLIMLTDKGSYELEKDNNNQLIMPAPLWLVHLNSELPYAYNDNMLEAIKKSQGGIVGSIEQTFLKQYHRKQFVEKNKSNKELNNSIEVKVENEQINDRNQIIPFAITDHYLWYAYTSDNSNVSNNNEFFTKLASKQWLEYLAVNKDTNSLPVLDELHSIAKENQLVTDYSSMLVLVNDRQKQALKGAEAKDDRFDREVERGSEDITSPTDVFSVQAVPEPEEWLLMGLVAIMLGVAYFRRKKNQELLMKVAV
ncbi:TIGR02921 family PEP-CTERM protein [Endozoicomonas sp. SM1973]|uniref:TIGR02921 family PEP-CTERM protein n=1 Tax=Spartinivicinus marinus TaxID=2994442 RepID=A0A853IBG0_9GAMM|nr:TIGR02921 family PEP-CTERM protein [Spartinivicinus marinus]MCX4026082.1 TIGR02921 family PEP-CTERM protein [Spartinivicinus marinus]NYZ66565.1 TIGR02921 family PEP-CTERM protein [Spartinivicinus marinus]